MTESFAGTYYPRLREVLDSRFAGLSDAELEAAFENAFGEGVSPAEYEELFGGLGNALGGIAKDVGKFAQKAAPFVASGAQGALQGAQAGSALGPYGALIGGLTGATGSVLQKAGGGTARDIGNVLTGVVGTAGALTGRGGAANLLGGAGRPPMQGQAPPAVANLLGLLQRPETGQALQALLGGRNTPVPVGQTATPVPANAFAGLLAALAREAEAEVGWDESESVPGYLANPNGALVVDPADPDQRAARLLQLLSSETDEDAEYAEDIDELAYESEYDELALYDRAGW
jgi:hypothetical protein